MEVRDDQGSVHQTQVPDEYNVFLSGRKEEKTKFLTKFKDDATNPRGEPYTLFQKRRTRWKIHPSPKAMRRPTIPGNAYPERSRIRTRGSSFTTMRFSAPTGNRASTAWSTTAIKRSPSWLWMSRIEFCWSANTATPWTCTRGKSPKAARRKEKN